MKRRKSLFSLMMLISSMAFAHDPFVSISKQSQWPILLSALLLLLIWIVYCIGCWKIWPGFKRWFLFQLTIFTVGMTIFGSLDEWAETNAAAHMTQHMLMMTVIAPLWVLAQPLPQFSRVIGRFSMRLVFPLLNIVQYPMLAALLHGAVIWFWHAPRLYLLALENPWWHVIEHACFIITAGLFWWSVLRCTKTTAAKAFLALLFTLMHTGLLGALFTFAHIPLYGKNSSLQNQQLAGLIMWVAGAIPYLLAVIWCSHRWLQQVYLNDFHNNNSKLYS
ncbi:cytochrome c oxidase assembly protein [Legionella clemsonensis]|uniref:Cytochrome c oxidase caa3 assembly factor (Caa3_CtaG) n=1 Tax=Legionella clemsonensis TaxID=1867846 RepID=A0A222P012_9GAMM|nr:cytochrome c oxidase assembly protein [Legionella clemsonensis]ASQ45182.1 Cytochrome c oxidase caa3 assembly factor (Caa3_CtaG) [Legionella clemsonensis]